MRTTAIIVAAVVVLGLAPAAEEDQRPRVSPHESVSGTVGGASISITYGRPYMKGRRIFGGLVPYGIVWCPGADEATVLDSNRDLESGTLRVPAGPHTIWMLPTADAWTLIISKEPSGFHTRYHPELDLGRIPLEKRALAAPVEQLTFEIRETDATHGTLAMRWETTEVSMPFTVVPAHARAAITGMAVCAPPSEIPPRGAARRELQPIFPPSIVAAVPSLTFVQ